MNISHAKRVSTTALICFNRFSLLKERLQQRFKVFDVRPLPTWKRAINPVDVASQNDQAKFVAESRFTLELVWREGATMIWNTKISAINTYITVMAWINDPVIKFDLERIFRCWKPMKEWIKRKIQQNLPPPLWLLQLLRQMASCIFEQSLGQQLLSIHQHQNTNPPALDKLWKIQSPEHVENCAILGEKVNIVEQFPKNPISCQSNFVQPCHRYRNCWEGHGCPFFVCWMPQVHCLLMTLLHQEGKQGVVSCWCMDAKQQKFFMTVTHQASMTELQQTLRGLSSLALTQVLYNTEKISAIHYHLRILLCDNIFKYVWGTYYQVQLKYNYWKQNTYTLLWHT